MKLKLRSRVILAAMAGICNGDFCSKASKAGAGMVTLGGLNFDMETLTASRKISQRGRREFEIDLHLLTDYLKGEVRKASINGTPVAVNVRAATMKGIIFAGESVSQSGATVLEINAHCRQPEMLSVGAGQALLGRLDELSEWIKHLKDSFNLNVILKWRGNVVDDLRVAKMAEAAGVDAFDIDAMKPGEVCGDLRLIRKLSENVDVFLIGNNSIRDFESAIRMLNSGADAVSIARAAIHDPTLVGRIALKVEEALSN